MTPAFSQDCQMHERAQAAVGGRCISQPNEVSLAKPPRVTRTLVKELQAKIDDAEREALKTKVELNEEVKRANFLLYETQKKVSQAQVELRDAEKARMEAERLVGEKMQELGIAHARGIIEYAELRAKRNDPKLSTLARPALWEIILRADRKLRTGLQKAGWHPGKMSANIDGLFESLSEKILLTRHPRESHALGGVVIPVGPRSPGPAPIEAQVLMHVARANFIRATFIEGDGTIVAESQDINAPTSRKPLKNEQRGQSPEL